MAAEVALATRVMLATPAPGSPEPSLEQPADDDQGASEVQWCAVHGKPRTVQHLQQFHDFTFAKTAEQQELLPMVPPLLEPSMMMPMAAPTMVETVQMVPTATPTMVETAVPMMQPTMMQSASPMMQMGAPAASAMPMTGNAMAAQAFPATAMQGIGGFGAQPW